MNSIIAALRDGTWLDPARITRLAIGALVATIVFVLYLAWTAHGLNDYSGRPLGTDFSSFYAAGRLAAAGASPYDPPSLHGVQQSVFGRGTPYYGFAYPPIFLLLTTPLARLDYLPALLVWQAATFALYFWAMTLLKWRFAPALPKRIFYLCAAGFTAVFVNLTHGQTGLLAAALFAAALALLDTRPILAGLCFGLVAFKPQLGLLVPFALAANGHWRSSFAAAATVLGLAMLSALLFGAHIWPEFLVAAGGARRVILEGGGVGYAKMVSVFSWLRLWHLPLPAAYFAQLIAALLVIAMTWRLWRSGADPRLKAAALCIGTLLVTPFALDYDLMLLAPAILLMAGYMGSRPAFPLGMTLLFVLWVMPLFARGIATITFVPLANWILAAGFVAAVTQARAR
jgi:alpha-1,2-mannosyltransferase